MTLGARLRAGLRLLRRGVGLLVLVAAVILVTFLVDLGYALIDPRLRK